MDLPCSKIRLLIVFLLFISVFFTAGCASVVSKVSSGMMEDLSKTIVNNNDLSMVEAGAPSYLLMIDSLISSDPDNEKTLTTASMLYSSYAELFVKDESRNKIMVKKALKYAGQAVCIINNDGCSLQKVYFKEFKTIISRMDDEDDIPALFALGNAWAGWIKANSDDFNALADISRVETIMKHIADLYPGYLDGSAYLFLGSLASILPPALGGKPDLAKTYFEEAIKISNGKNLMVKVLYAKQYARMIFDKDLHDKLLQDVINADPEIEGYTLVNTHAQILAKELLDSSEDYF